MPPELAERLARTYVVALTPICLALCAVGFWKLWQWMRRMTPR